MTDARLGGLGREALVSSTGQLRAGGVVREALVSGTGLAGRASGRSKARGVASVLFAGVTLSGSTKAQSSTRVARPSLSINVAGRIAARSKARVSMPVLPAVLAGRIAARSQARIIPSNSAIAIMGGRITAIGSASATVSAAPPSLTRQYAVSMA